ncbi:MAG: S1 RNA-binding domain-containing protein [Candidatus Obscuribacterales bacterium]|nr:S1 RNA-binding domain-containing protein [Candidatus Obscuribacterales bacterium]
MKNTNLTGVIVGGNKGSKGSTKIEAGMVVTGQYHKGLPAGVLVRLSTVVGVVTPQGRISVLETPVSIKGDVVGKQSVRQLPGERTERDALLEAINAETSESLKNSDPVTMVVQSVSADGKMELSESEYLRRNARGELKEGDIITVTVKNVADFGVFCAITPYEDGLVHVSQVKRRPAAPTPGETMEVVVLELKDQPDGKLRCGLSEIGVAVAKQRAIDAKREAEQAAALEAGKAMLPKLVAHVWSTELDQDGRELVEVEGSTGVARVTGNAGDHLKVVFVGDCGGEVAGTLPDAELYCPKASVARVGNNIKVRVIGVDLVTGTVTVSRKGMAKPKAGKK